MTAVKIKNNRFFDSVLWLIMLAIVVAGVWANYHYAMVSVPLRVIAWIVLVIIVLAIASLTSQGKRTWGFAKAARGELRKVVWPKRQEVVQMTMIVIALVIVLSLIIWGLDSFLLWAIGLLTGQRG
mgnify:CR=1 FL=1